VIRRRQNAPTLAPVEVDEGDDAAQPDWNEDAEWDALADPAQAEAGKTPPS
jgi:hypothetical protein